MNEYQVIVGNIGTVDTFNNPVKALACYGHYVESSKTKDGRASDESVTIMRNGEPWREYDPSRGFYFVEMTDTFGGEANYCWVNRFKVKASSVRGAIRKVARETGYSGHIHKTMDSGDMTRHDVRGACICFFTEWFDTDNHSRYSNIKEI